MQDVPYKLIYLFNNTLSSGPLRTPSSTHNKMLTKSATATIAIAAFAAISSAPKSTSGAVCGCNDVVLNEIHAYGKGPTDYIELYNKGSTNCELTGFKFDDAGSAAAGTTFTVPSAGSTISETPLCPCLVLPRPASLYLVLRCLALSEAPLFSLPLSSRAVPTLPSPLPTISRRMLTRLRSLTKRSATDAGAYKVYYKDAAGSFTFGIGKTSDMVNVTCADGNTPINGYGSLLIPTKENGGPHGEFAWGRKGVTGADLGQAGNMVPTPGYPNEALYTIPSPFPTFCTCNDLVVNEIHNSGCV